MSSQPVPGPVGRPRGRRLSGIFRRQGWQGLLFILPTVLLLGALVAYPLVSTIVYSFGDTNAKLDIVRWVGFDNYERLFTRDRVFLDRDEFPPEGALVNNLKWALLYTTFSLGLGLLIAILAARVRYESFVKAIIFVPMAISATAVAIIWKFVYEPDPDKGVLNAVLSGSFDMDPIVFLGRADTVNYAIIFAYVWASTGFAMVVLSAALKGIPEEIIEAARTDGANEWHIFRRIQFPLLSLPMAVVTVWLTINVIKLFDVIYVLTRGGPGNASEVIATQMFAEAFTGEGGYGAAIAVVMMLLIIPVMIWNISRFRSERVVGT
jgi:alpha-glucoside transport system permease protein